MSLIPASIGAELSSQLQYSPHVHVQTVEIDRTSDLLLPMATSDFVKWYVAKDDFLNMIAINPDGVDSSNNIFTMSAGLGRPMPEASGAVLDFHSLAQTYVVSLVDPSITNGSVDAPARIGNMDVCYNQVLGGHQSSDTTRGWTFGQSSVALTLRWQTDASGNVRVTADPNAHITVNKPYNDAAADFIQIRMEGDEMPAHGVTPSSVDVVSASIDYGERFEVESAQHIRTVVGEPTVTVDDVLLTKSLQRAINSDAVMRDISDTPSLRRAVDDAIRQGNLLGFQSPLPLQTTLSVTIAGEQRLDDDVSQNLTPIIVIDPATI